MAAMNSRRGGDGQGGGKGGGKSGAKPPQSPRPKTPPPRLAGLSRASRHQAAAPRASASIASFVLMSGAAIAGAAWIGGSLFDAREAVALGVDNVAARAGLHAGIEVEGVEGARRAEIEAVAMPEGRGSMLGASPAQVKARVESLDWVDDVRVARVWPSTIRIRVKRREAFALWQENGVTSVIDAAGERVHGAAAADKRDLPRVVGPGAGPAAEPLLAALEDTPELRARLAALVRVGDRRWDVRLKSGMTVQLPESDPVRALHALERAQKRLRALDGAYERLDLRAPGRMIAMPRKTTSPAAPATRGV